MQPLQYDLRCPAAKYHSMTRTAAAARNLDASIAMRSAPHDGKPACIYAHGSSGGNMHAAIALQSATADCKRPCNCAHIKHRTLQKTPCRNQSLQNECSRTRCTHELPFIAGWPLYTEKHNVSRSGILPNTSPMQHSCSHYNAN